LTLEPEKQKNILQSLNQSTARTKFVQTILYAVVVANHATEMVQTIPTHV